MLPGLDAEDDPDRPVRDRAGADVPLHEGNLAGDRSDRARTRIGFRRPIYERTPDEETNPTRSRHGRGSRRSRLREPGVRRVHPKLAVQMGTAGTTIHLTIPPTDDPTARLTFFVPAGTGVNLGATAGSTIGTLDAKAAAGALGGATLPLTGTVQARAANGTYLSSGVAVPLAQAATACTTTAVHGAFWVLVLSAAGQTLEVPLFVDPVTSGPLSAAVAATLSLCLPPSDIPEALGGAAFGAKVFEASFTVKGVFSPTAGTNLWRLTGTPYKPGKGTPNAPATVEAQSYVETGSVVLGTIKRVLTKLAATFTAAGKVTSSGTGATAAVTLARGSTATKVTTFAHPAVSGRRRVLGEVRRAARGQAAAGVRPGDGDRAGARSRRLRLQGDLRHPVHRRDGERLHRHLGREGRARPEEVAPLRGRAPARGPLSILVAWRSSGSGRARGPTRASSRTGTRGACPRPAARLAYYAERFDTVEVDSPFYRLPSPETTAKWAERTPDDFTWHAKASAAMTGHEEADRETAFREFREAFEPLEASGKLRGVLLQYHPRVVKSRRGQGGDRGRRPAARAARSRSSSSATARGSRRTSGRTRSRSWRPTGSPTSRSTRRARGPRTSFPASPPRRRPSPTSASTAATGGRGTSAARDRRPTGSTGCTRRRSSRSGSSRCGSSPTRPRRSTR